MTRSDPIALSDPAINSVFSGLFNTAKSGVTVNQDTATRHTTVYACYKVLSEGVAGLPLNLMRSKKKNGKAHKEKAIEHPLYNLLHLRPNDEMTSYTWMIATMLNLVSRGVSYSQIIRNQRGDIAAIYPLLSDNMQVYRDENNKMYFVYNSSKYGRVLLSKDEVLHTLGSTLDGINPISPIQANANSLGLSIAMEEFGSNFFANGANGSGAFTTDQELSEDAFNRLKSDLKTNYTSLMNSGKPMLLEEGLKYDKFTIPNNDSQFLESRKYQRSEIASIFRVPLHMINDLEKSSFNNMEQQSLDFAIHTLRPWVIALEQSMTVAFFGTSSEYYIKFNLAALLRGDTKTRYEAYGTGIRDGWLTRNEAREMEDLNPIDGLDDPILPLNMTNLKEEN